MVDPWASLEFKSQLCHVLAIWLLSIYLTSCYLISSSQNENNNSSYIIRFLWKSTKIVSMKCLEWNLKHSRGSVRVCPDSDDYKVKSNAYFFFLHSPASTGLILLASFSYHIWLSFVIREVIKQRCPEVKSNQVENEPEVDTCFQNNNREEVIFFPLTETTHLGRSLQQALTKGFTIIPMLIGDFLPGTPLGGLTW